MYGLTFIRVLLSSSQPSHGLPSPFVGVCGLCPDISVCGNLQKIVSTA